MNRWKEYFEKLTEENQKAEIELIQRVENDEKEILLISTEEIQKQLIIQGHIKYIRIQHNI